MRQLFNVSILKILILSAFVFCFNYSYAQKLKNFIADGKEALENKEYYLAENYFKKAISIDSTTTELQYLYAEACRLNLNYLVAERWYNKVYKKDNGKQYPDALFNLALCKKNNGRYKDAIKMFEKYAKRNKKKNATKAGEATKESQNCSYALMLIKNPLPIKVFHLDTMVNSKNGEYSPYELDSILFFSSVNTSGNQVDSRIYSAMIKKNKYSYRQLIDSTINKPGQSITNITFSEEGDKMYCTRCLNNDCDIYEYHFNGSTFMEEKKLPVTINAKNYINTQPYFTKFNNRNVLFFASNRPGGFGGMDIWYSLQDEHNNWQEPKNAGSKVNSAEDEITPFFCNPCQTLYFSSTHHQGMGGFDIFKSFFDAGQFGEPENLGFPINSPQNDMYFKYNNTRTKAYLVSNREGSYFEKNETCCNDIYYFNISTQMDSVLVEKQPKDSVFIAKSRLQTLVPLTLYFNNDEPDSKTTKTTTQKTYTETLNSYLIQKDNYLKAYAKGLTAEQKEIAINEMSDFFEDSVRSAYQELERFTELMLFVLQKGEKVHLTLKGYCSPLASTDYNINLAKRRISSLLNYFNAYKNGALVTYINDKSKLEITIEEIGELKASHLVSDNPNDATNSVYSRSAALERKIQIIAVSTGK
ncbi:MAG: tetratricopeptide repeat protein [Bacteroidia bacterium]|nr:tetratricopeptide repeat protein [Bacteroidia bacterium]MCZ2247216.1 tetratricopeptide repeat protein [Bacteroidia bacterium]